MRNRRESLLEYFFRHRLLRERVDANTHAKIVWLEEESKIKGLMHGESGENLRAIERLVVHNSGVKPESVWLSYDDEFCSRMVAIEQDSSSALAGGEPGKKVESLFQYLAQLRDTLTQSQAYLRLPSTQLTYDEIQQHDEWVEVNNLLGEKIKLADVTPASFNFVLEQALTYYASHGAKILNLLFFGSRVMTRPEVVKRQPHLVELLPIEDNGVVKDLVRLQGVKISNWQIRFVYDRLSYPFGDLLIEKSMYRELRQRMNSRFGNFPVSALLIPVSAGANLDEQLDAAIKEMERKGKIGTPTAQYASLSHMKWWNDFPQGTGRLPQLEKLWAEARASARPQTVK